MGVSGTSEIFQRESQKGIGGVLNFTVSKGPSNRGARHFVFRIKGKRNQTKRFSGNVSVTFLFVHREIFYFFISNVSFFLYLDRNFTLRVEVTYSIMLSNTRTLL